MTSDPVDLEVQIGVAGGEPFDRQDDCVGCNFAHPGDVVVVDGVAFVRGRSPAHQHDPVALGDQVDDLDAEVG